MHMLRKVDWSKWDAKLGEATDAWIAQKTGVSHQAVGYRRRRLGISAPTGDRAAALAVIQSIKRALRASSLPLPVRVVHRTVVHDYDAIALRTVHRYLHRLVEQGDVRVVREPGAPSRDHGYALVRVRRSR